MQASNHSTPILSLPSSPLAAATERRSSALASAVDAALVEALCFLTRKEVSLVEEVTKKFCHLIRTYPLPMLHFIKHLDLDERGLTCGVWPLKFFQTPSFVPPDLMLSDIDLDSAAGLALIDSSRYVRFMDACIDLDCGMKLREQGMRWLRSLCHAFDSCQLDLYPMDMDHLRKNISKKPMHTFTSALLEIFINCNTISVFTSEMKGENDDIPVVEVATLVSWLHSGGAASKSEYESELCGINDTKVRHGMTRGNSTNNYLFYVGCKRAKLSYRINQRFYTELRKELSKVGEKFGESYAAYLPNKGLI